ncbi:MAG: helix-turn-helix transcriptional regulator, partial [Propionibacteriaceae bacterium]|nr:helix-turn-helix transcriptional regulator [Propionibacteriaceae bacterium]
MIRREQAERSRELLLDAAAEEFWLHGLGGTRIQDILDRAGMTKGGLYHHFTSKQEMADALLAQEAERWPQLIEAVTGSQARGIA